MKNMYNSIVFNNLITLLEERAKNSQSKIKFVDRDEKIQSLSYQQIYEKSILVSNHLKNLSIRIGSTVGILLPTCPEFLYSFFGAQMAGLIPVAIYPPLKLGLVDEWQQNAKNQLSAVNAQVILTDSKGSLVIGSYLKFGSVDVTKTILDEKLNTLNDNSFSPHRLAFLQFSSGTTGTVKAVAISHENVLSNCESIVNGFHEEIIKNKNRVCVSWLPLYHDMGLVGALLTSVYSDTELYLLRPENFIGSPYHWLKIISDVKATITVAPNFAFGLCTRRLDDEHIKNLDLSTLQVALCGAEMIHPKTINDFGDKFEKCGFKKSALTPVYGLAEATLAVSFSKTNEAIYWTAFDSDTLQPGSRVKKMSSGTRLATVGKPLKNIKIEIRNEKNLAVPDETIGCLWISGPSVMKEYYNQPSLTQETLVDSWFNTGDYGFFFENQLFITGRKKEIVLIRGKNYDPTLIERTLAHFDELREGCSVAFSSSKQNSETEELFVVSEIKKGLKLSVPEENSLMKKISIAIANEHGIELKKIQFYRQGTLPRTSSGKIKRRLTKEYWEKDLLKTNSEKFAHFKLLKAIVKNKLKVS